MATGISMTHYLAQALLNEVLRATNYAAPATVYVALFTAAPTDSGGGTEVAGGAYVREAVTFGAPTNSGTGDQCVNSADVVWPVATGSYGTVVAIALFDASSAGNMLLYATITGVLISVGQQAKIPTGQLTVLFD